MTILDAISLLQAHMQKHGQQTEVYFDCPKCGTAFTPNRLVAEAVHLTSEKLAGKES